MRLSRHCYDKPRRCPGWAGGGWTGSEVSRCDSGMLRTFLGTHTDPWYDFRWHRCTKCDVLAVPVAVQWLDPTWVWWWAGRRIDSLTYDLSLRPRKFFRYWHPLSNWRYRLRHLWEWYRPGSRQARQAEARYRRRGTLPAEQR